MEVVAKSKMWKAVSVLVVLILVSGIVGYYVGLLAWESNVYQTTVEFYTTDGASFSGFIGTVCCTHNQDALNVQSTPGVELKTYEWKCQGRMSVNLDVPTGGHLRVEVYRSSDNSELGWASIHQAGDLTLVVGC